MCYADSMMTTILWDFFLFWDACNPNLQQYLCSRLSSRAALILCVQKVIYSKTISMPPTTAYMTTMQSLSSCHLRISVCRSVCDPLKVETCTARSMKLYAQWCSCTSNIYNTLKWQLKFYVLMIHKISFYNFTKYWNRLHFQQECNAALATNTHTQTKNVFKV